MQHFWTVIKAMLFILPTWRQTECVLCKQPSAYLFIVTLWIRSHQFFSDSKFSINWNYLTKWSKFEAPSVSNAKSKNIFISSCIQRELNFPLVVSLIGYFIWSDVHEVRNTFSFWFVELMEYFKNAFRTFYFYLFLQKQNI